MPTLSEVTVSPLFSFGTAFTDGGKPLAGGKIFSYEGGSSSILAPTYDVNTDTPVQNANPIVLDSNGRLPDSLWLLSGQQYHLVLTKSDGTTILEEYDYVVPAASEAYVDNAIAGLDGDFLPITGGTLTGSLVVQGTSNLQGTVTVTGAVNASGAGSFSSVTATTLTGGINANSVRVINVATPSVGTDAANKTYVDGVVSTGGVPSGSILYWGTSVAPAGFLKCDGTSYLRASYASLFAVIGTTYGSVDGTHFNVPDLRGYFVRGLDEGRGVDPGRAIGTNQADAFQNIVGYLGVDDRVQDGSAAVGAFQSNGSTPSQAIAAGAPNIDTTAEGGDGRACYAKFDASLSVGARTSTETRPTNIALVGIIKT